MVVDQLNEQQATKSSKTSPLEGGVNFSGLPT
jgi:hypothetical protein